MSNVAKSQETPQRSYGTPQNLVRPCKVYEVVQDPDTSRTLSKPTQLTLRGVHQHLSTLLATSPRRPTGRSGGCQRVLQGLRKGVHGFYGSIRLLYGPITVRIRNISGCYFKGCTRQHSDSLRLFKRTWIG